MQPSTATLVSASRSAARLVLCSPRASIPGAQRVTIETRAARLRITGYSAARPSGVCCLESLSSAQRPRLGGADAVEVKQHGGGHQRAGQAAAPGLVGAGHEAHAEPAIEARAGVAAGRLRRPAPLAALRGCRSGPGASR